MAGEKKFFLPKSLPVWLGIPLAALMVLGLVALVLIMRNSNRWWDLFLPALLGSVLLLAMIHWLLYIRRTDKRVQVERNQLRTLIDNMPDLIYVKDTQGRKIISNIADWQASGGKALEDVIGKTDFDFYPSELAARFWADDKAVIDTGVPIIDREEPARDPLGNPIWLLTTKMPLRDGKGRIVGLVGIGRDITALKLSREAMEDTKERYQKIFEESVEGIYQSTSDGKFITINPSLVHMLGYNSPADMIAGIDDIGNLYVDASRRGEFKRRLESAGTISGFESEVYCKDGSKIWVSENGRVVRGGSGTVSYYEGAVVNITERKRAEDARHIAEEKYRSFFESSLEGIFQTTPEGEFITANPALAQMLGYDSPEELMASVTDLNQQLYVDPPHRLELKKRLEEEGKVSAFESELYRKDGSTIWILENALAVRDEHGNPLYYEGSLVDITARKQIEQTQEETHRKQVIWISELEQRTREITILNEMSDLLQCCPTIEEAYSVITQQAQWLFPQESGALYILGSSRNIAESVAAWGIPLNDPPTFTPTDCWAFRRGQLHVVERDVIEREVTADHRNNMPVLICQHLRPPLPETYICAPLIAQGETLGVLHLRHNIIEDSNIGTSEVWYTEARQQLAHTVADSLALAISNLKLRESLRQQSIRDPLTGMFNRRYLEESLDREIARAGRAGHALGVIMLDIDHFKHFNDIYGHEAGDAVLRELGVFFRSQIRESDIACRYGGEEFALILPDASLEITGQRAEKMHEQVKHLQVMYQKQLVGGVTLSAGVAEFPSHGSTGEVLLRIADDALYRAKKTGRDRVVIGES